MQHFQAVPLRPNRIQVEDLSAVYKTKLDQVVHHPQATQTCQLGVESYVNAGQAWNEWCPVGDLTEFM